MTDIVEVFSGYCDELEWNFSYGNAANLNLLRSNALTDDVYFLLDPVTRVKEKGQYGGTGLVTFNGSFMVVVKSTLDNVYHNQKEVNSSDGKYEKNIKPLLTDGLDSLESLIDCSEYQINNWSIIDVINALDVNLDGVIVTFEIQILD